MSTEQLITHVGRHHPGIAVLSATINGTTVYFGAEGGEPVHTFLSQIAQGECAKQLLLMNYTDPTTANVTWTGLVSATTEIGMNVKYAFSTLTDPACVASMTVKCFAAFNAVAPCVIKAILQTGVEATKSAASSQAIGAGIGGTVAGLVAASAVAAGLFFWKRKNNPEATNLLRTNNEINNAL